MDEVIRLQSVDSTEDLDRNPLFTTTIMILVTNQLCLYRQRVIFQFFSWYCLHSWSLIMWENIFMFSVFNGNILPHFLHWNLPSLALRKCSMEVFMCAFVSELFPMQSWPV